MLARFRFRVREWSKLTKFSRPAPVAEAMNAKFFLLVVVLAMVAMAPVVLANRRFGSHQECHDTCFNHVRAIPRCMRFGAARASVKASIAETGVAKRASAGVETPTKSF